VKHPGIAADRASARFSSRRIAQSCRLSADKACLSGCL
jgi:hypothetical protein